MLPGPAGGGVGVEDEEIELLTAQVIAGGQAGLAATHHDAIVGMHLLDELSLTGRGDGRRAGFHAELLIDVDEVGLDRGFGDEEPLGNLLVGISRGQRLQDLQLARGQRVSGCAKRSARRLVTSGAKVRFPAAVSSTAACRVSSGASLSR